MAKYLAIADADRVQDYVFTPSQLRYVRGGSELQKRAIEKIGAYAGACKVYANGGVALAEYDSEDRAKAFCERAREVFAEITGSATCTTAIAPYEGDFKAGWKRVRDAVESAKRQSNAVEALGQHWLQATCERCGERGAEMSVQEHETSRIVCRTCRLKLEAGSPAKLRNHKPPQDFEELAGLSTPSNYLALIYIDLDRLGRYFDEHIKEKEECQRISKAVDDAVRTSVERAGERICLRSGPHNPKDNKKPTEPYIELMAGGDDAIVMVAAHLAVPFLQYFREAFEDAALWTGLAQRPTFSVGLVLAHHHLPIWEFLRTAKALYVSAKQRKGAHSIAFQVVSSSIADVLGGTEDLDGSYAVGKPTGNPYLLDDFLMLGDDIAQLKGMEAPRSKMHGLYEAAWKTPLQGELEYLTLLLRLPTKARAVVRRAIGPELRYLRDDESGATKAADLVELWEFVHV